MSIYASLLAPDDAAHEDGCACYAEISPDIYDFSGQPCDCGQPDAPIVYQGSHILPSDSDRRGGRVDIAFIPSHITRDGRDGRDDQPADKRPWPYLRLGVNQETVVLTVRNVRQVVETMSGWLQEVEG